MKHTISCHVKDGRPNNAKKLNAAFQEFEGKDVVVTVEKKKSKRSEQQNKYYWACVIMDEIDCIKEHWGEIWSKDDMHSFNKVYFFGDEKVNQETGEIIKVPKSSITTKDNFSEAIEKIKQFFQLQFNYRIREANEVLFND